MSTNLWQRIEQARVANNVLEHPFYRRWSAGKLTHVELAHYSGQYRYATEAIAKLSADIAAAAPEAERASLEIHAAEEAEHVAMWDGFVNAVGGTVGAEPNPETLKCVETWTRSDGFGRQLARMFAIESGQPAISRSKSEGLGEHYEITDAPGNLYFTVHAEKDVQHADEIRNLLERYMSEFSEDEVVEAAEEAFEANWLLLDGAEKARA